MSQEAVIDFKRIVENWDGQPEGYAHTRDLIEELEKSVGPLQNEIIHLQTQLRQSEQALATLKTKSYNDGIEDAARLIEANYNWFESDEQQDMVAEEIRNLKD